MPLEPKHPSRGDRPAAERQFVGREEFVAPVHAALKEPPRTKPLVLVYYGGAGIGKSRLRRELTKQMASDPGALTATLDFAIPIYRQPDAALFFLRKAIREAYQVKFPSFDIAFAIYWQKTHPDTPMRAGDTIPNRGDSGHVPDELQPLLEPGSPLSQLLDDKGKLPLIGLVPKISSLALPPLESLNPRPLDPFLRTWWSERGEHELQDLPQMEPAAVVEQLPKLWASDLKDELQHGSRESRVENSGAGDHSPLSTPYSRSAVMFIDAYEQLWESGGTEADFFKRDEWVRELVEQLPEVLWVICGRQRLRWEEVEADWGKALSQHQLGALPDKSARRFLTSCGITNEPIQDAIVKGSQGVPHYLDLAVDTVERTKDKGQRTELTGDNPDELVQQFIRHLNEPEIETLQVLSGPRFWYYGLFENLMTEYQTGYPLTAYDDLSRFSFVNEGAAPGTRTMHELMREALQESQSPELRKRVHLFLHELYAKQLEGLDVKNITDQHRAALTEAFYHGRQAKSAAELWAWFKAAARVFNEARQDRLLSPLYREMVQALEAELGPEHPDVARSLNCLARAVHKQERYAEAEPLYCRALALGEKVFGPEHPEVAQPLRDLAGLLDFLDRHTEAEPLLRRSLAIREKALGPEHPDTGDSLIGLVLLQLEQGRCDEAEPLARRALAIAEKVFGPDHPLLSDGLYSLARTLTGQGKYAEAEHLYRRALSIREKTLGPKHPITANAVEKLALLSEWQGRYAEAEPLYKRALAIYEVTLGPDSFAVARTLDNMGTLRTGEGKYSEAELLHRRSLAIMEKVLGPEHSETARLLSNLACALRRQGRYAESEPLARRSLAATEKVLGPEHPTVAYSLNVLCMVLTEQGRYAEAEPPSRRALAIREKALGPEHPEVATSLNELGGTLRMLGRYAEAEPPAWRALGIAEKTLGPEHPDVGYYLYSLAALCLCQGKYAEGEPLARRQLAIWEAKLGPEHPNVAWPLDILAELLWHQGKYAEAESLARRSLAMREKALEPEHEGVADSMDALIGLFLKQGRYAEAEPLARRALAIRGAKLGPDHSDVAKSLDFLAGLCEQTGRTAEAEALCRRALAIREKVFGPDHPFTAETLEGLAKLCEQTGRTVEAQELSARAQRIRAQAESAPANPQQ